MLDALFNDADAPKTAIPQGRGAIQGDADVVTCLVVLALACCGVLALGLICSRRTPPLPENDEGVSWDWADSECGGYRPDLGKAEREELARRWRAHGSFAE